MTSILYVSYDILLFLTVKALTGCGHGVPTYNVRLLATVIIIIIIIIKYILLEGLVCSIVGYFYESCHILASP